MLANLNTRNFLAQVDGGFPPGTSLSVGTQSGKVFAIGGPGLIRKYGMWLQAIMGSASGVLTMLVYTATASNGTFALASGLTPSIGSLVAVAMSQAISITTSAQRYVIDMETRGEALGSTGGTWAQVVVIVAGAAMEGCLTILGFNVGSEPASNYDSATITTVELDVM